MKWTVKYRSCWPSLLDPQVHVTRLGHVWPTICVSYFHNRKVEKTLFKGVLAPPWGMDAGVRCHWMKADTPGYLGSKYECFLISVWWDMQNFNVKLWSNPMESWTNEQTERRTLYNINAGGIKMAHQYMFKLFVLNVWTILKAPSKCYADIDLTDKWLGGPRGWAVKAVYI